MDAAFGLLSSDLGCLPTRKMMSAGLHTRPSPVGLQLMVKISLLCAVKSCTGAGLSTRQILAEPSSEHDASSVPAGECSVLGSGLKLGLA